MYSLIVFIILLHFQSDANPELRQKWNFIVTFHRITLGENVVCTGSAITKALVVSAAHCFNNVDKNRIKAISKVVYDSSSHQNHSILELIQWGLIDFVQ